MASLERITFPSDDSARSYGGPIEVIRDRGVIGFVALANRRKTIRTDIARDAVRYLATQLEAVTAPLGKTQVTDDELPPVVALLMTTGVSQVLALEEALGVTAEHETTWSSLARTTADVDPTTEI
jgi:hypothetical protein